MGFISLVFYDRVPGEPVPDARRYNLRRGHVCTDDPDLGPCDCNSPTYTRWTPAYSEIVYLKTLKDNFKNHEKLIAEREDLLSKGAHNVVLLHHERAAGDSTGNRVERRQRQRISNRLARKFLQFHGRVPITAAQAAVDTAIEEEKAHRAGEKS